MSAIMGCMSKSINHKNKNYEDISNGKNLVNWLEFIQKYLKLYNQILVQCIIWLAKQIHIVYMKIYIV